MRPAILLDTSVLGLLVTPAARSTDARDCARWLAQQLRAEVRVLMPEIADYELRRELVRLSRAKALAKLDALGVITEYLTVSTRAFRRAADLWADARRAGQPTAGDKNIDVDVILAAQALTLEPSPTIIATTNVRHLARFASAEVWSKINA